MHSHAGALEREKANILHEVIVMPNHFHGIVEFVGAGPRACPINEYQQINGTTADDWATTGGCPYSQGNCGVVY